MGLWVNLNIMAGKFKFISMHNDAFGTDPLYYNREEVGGKAQGLLNIHQTLQQLTREFPEITIDIPPMSVIGTSVFDAFIKRNALIDIAYSNNSDDHIAHAFQLADMPFEILGDLRKLVDRQSIPLAVRSSGLLEDSTSRPFAGVYLTKLIPNNHLNPDIRFQKLIEAIKFVWASTYYKIAKDYCKATNLNFQDEKMAVIIQEVVGKRHDTRFYPELSGVARSYNYYPFKPAKPVDGVVDLALGLGKTIVDGGRSWTYSPAFPKMPPPFESVQKILDETQNEFWVINLGEPFEYNPIKETEYMLKEDLRTAEKDRALTYLVSTFDPLSERFSIGTGNSGPRALTFAPLLTIDNISFNHLIQTLLFSCETAVGSPVEIEFAMTFDPHNFGLLQVRPMSVPTEELIVNPNDLLDENAVVSSEMVLGNGTLENIYDIVYVKPDSFELKFTSKIAEELEEFNHTLLKATRPYLLIVFGRLGTLDPWLGIPVNWGQISGAKAIIEATQENARVELSQGSHYFHNIINLGIKYFSMPFTSPYHIDWNWINEQSIVTESMFVRHVRLSSPLKIIVDGQNGRGVIFKS
jgi:hypothetical protein